MDLLAEIFVMDAVSGVTTFALCDVSVDVIGSTILDSAQVALDITKINNEAISMKPNSVLTNIVSCFLPECKKRS